MDDIFSKQETRNSTIKLHCFQISPEEKQKTSIIYRRGSSSSSSREQAGPQHSAAQQPCRMHATPKYYWPASKNTVNGRHQNKLLGPHQKGFPPFPKLPCPSIFVSTAPMTWLQSRWWMMSCMDFVDLRQCHADSSDWINHQGNFEVHCNRFTDSYLWICYI